MTRISITIFLWLSLINACYAQNVQQSGVITPGHAACWAITGVIYDCGSPGGGVSVVGSTTANDLAAFNGSGSLIDSGINPTSTSSWSGLQNFNGGATAPTQNLGDNTTNVANTAFVTNAFTNFLDTSKSFVSPLVMPTGDGANYLFQNGSKTAVSIYGATGSLRTYGNVRSVVDIEGATSQNYSAYDAFIYNNVAWDPAGVTGAAGVGLETFCINAVANAACFGLNPAGSDSYDATTGHSVASKVIAGEADFNMFNAGSIATGWSFVINGPTQPAGATVFDVLNNMSMGQVAQWTNGLFLENGAFTSGGVGIILGTAGSAPGTSINTISSLPIRFNLIDTASPTGTERAITVKAIPNGTGNSALSFTDTGINAGVFFIFGPTTASPQIIMSGSSTNAGSLIGSTAAGGGLTLKSTSNGFPSGDYIQLVVGGSTVFDCNVTSSDWCAAKAANGLLISGNYVEGTNSGAFAVANSTASATVPTLLPNKASTTGGIGADTAGDVSIIASATEIMRATSSALTFNAAATFTKQIITTFGMPSIASGACGATTNGSVSGTNQAGLITIGSATTTTCTVSFSTTITAPNSCVVFPANATAAATGTTVARVSSIGTTSFVVSGSALASSNYYYICI